MKKKYTSEVFGGGDYDATPDSVDFTLTKDGAEEILRLAQIVKDNELYKVERFDYTPNWWYNSADWTDESEEGDKETASTEGSTLNVSNDEFWYSAYIKNTDIEFRTDFFNLKELSEAFGITLPVVQKVTINLNLFDDEGEQVDTVTQTLSENAIGDIIDHASQVILARRDNPAGVEDILNELENALVVYDVISEE